MRTSRWPGALAVVSLAVMPAFAAAQERPEVTGSRLSVELVSGGTLRGELIEATGGRLLLRDELGLQEVDLTDVRRVRAQRHGFTAGRVATWVGLGALATGLGMSAACAQVEDTDCSGVFPAVALSWVVVGGLSGVVLASSAWETVGGNAEGLARYARFPQGAPPGFRPPGR